MVICTWLVELKLKTLNELRASKFDAGLMSDDSEEFEAKALMHETVLKGVEMKFQEFLSKNQEDLDQDTILQLLQSHGQIGDCIKYADAMKLYQKLVVHFINKRDNR